MSASDAHATASLEAADDAAAIRRAADRLAAWVDKHPQLFVLTGAGCSTASGIPDYRDRGGAWKRPQPIQLQDFVKDINARRRYWARSLIGWQGFAHARPSASHHSLAQLETQGRIQQLVTQNVDRLHQQAGQQQVIDLHGRLDRLRCLQCERISSRAGFQRELSTLNPGFAALSATSAPDGDADFEMADFSAFVVPDCSRCGGMLKPDVVFFGESVPPPRVETAIAQLDEADALLVVGSSLMVFSGFRFCRLAAQKGLPIAALNRGRTRADDLLALKLETECGATLRAVAGHYT